jgi:hypothetical protein
MPLDRSKALNIGSVKVRSAPVFAEEEEEEKEEEEEEEEKEEEGGLR